MGICVMIIVMNWVNYGSVLNRMMNNCVLNIVMYHWLVMNSVHWFMMNSVNRLVMNSMNWVMMYCMHGVDGVMNWSSMNSLVW